MNRLKTILGATVLSFGLVATFSSCSDDKKDEPAVPAAKSGIAAAVVLGVGRAIGEAMAVIMVSGNAPNMPSLFESVRFLTTAVASEMSYASGLQQQALYSIALVLFLFIMLINAALNFFLKRDKEKA